MSVLAGIDRHRVAVAILLFAAHVALKAPGAGARSLWLDEAWSVALAHRSAPEVIAASRADQNPPLYNLALRPWVAVFGDSEAAARWPSVLASAATASALFLLARRFFGVETAVWASLLFAAAEPHLYYAREARSYAVVGLLCTVSFHLFLATLTRPRWSTALALGVVNAAAAWTHFTAILAAVAQAAVAPLFLRARPRGVALVAAAQAIALALFAPWLGALFSNLPRSGRFWLAPPGPAQAGEVVRELAGGGLALGASLAVLAVAIAATLRDRGVGAGAPPASGRRAAEDGARDPRLLAVAAAWAVVPLVVAFAISQRFPAFLLRYLLFASLGWLLLVAAAVARLPVALAGRAVAACAIALLAARELDWTRARSADWRTAVVLAEPGPGSAVVVAPGWQCLPFSYYLDRAAFADEARRVRRLQQASVLCLESLDEADPERLGSPPRIAVVAGKDVPGGVPGLLDRLRDAGYAAGTARPFRGGQVIELRRSGTR